VCKNENFDIGQEPVTFACFVGQRMGLGVKMGMIIDQGVVLQKLLPFFFVTTSILM